MIMIIYHNPKEQDREVGKEELNDAVSTKGYESVKNN